MTPDEFLSLPIVERAEALMHFIEAHPSIDVLPDRERALRALTVGVLLGASRNRFDWDRLHAVYNELAELRALPPLEAALRGVDLPLDLLADVCSDFTIAIHEEEPKP